MEKMEIQGGGGGGSRSGDGRFDDFFGVLPEGIVANALSLTNPRDACRLSLVGSVFRSASEWDAVWERFLPPDYQEIIAQSVDRDGYSRRSAHLRFASKKELYLYLCDHPLLIDGGYKSFSLDKQTGKKCYMLAVRDLSIVWGDTPRYWRWISIPESRFAEVAELITVCWFEIQGKMSTRLLSPETNYAAYLVFKSNPQIYGFEYQPAEVWVGVSGVDSQTRTVYLDPDGGQRRQPSFVPRRMFTPNHRGIASRALIHALPKANGPFPKLRGDGWLEIELGEYFNKGGEDAELEMTVTEVKGGNWKGGLIIQGIEIRPKAGK